MDKEQPQRLTEVHGRYESHQNGARFSCTVSLDGPGVPDCFPGLTEANREVMQRIFASCAALAVGVVLDALRISKLDLDAAAKHPLGIHTAGHRCANKVIAGIQLADLLKKAQKGDAPE